MKREREENKKILRRAATYLLVFAVAVLFVLATDIGCVWRKFFGFHCPSCGLTRAWLCFLKGDLGGAFSYHFMFWSVPVLFLYVFFKGNLFKNEKLNYVVLGAILLGFIVRWILWFI